MGKRSKAYQVPRRVLRLGVAGGVAMACLPEARRKRPIRIEDPKQLDIVKRTANGWRYSPLDNTIRGTSSISTFGLGSQGRR